MGLADSWSKGGRKSDKVLKRKTRCTVHGHIEAKVMLFELNTKFKAVFLVTVYKTIHTVRVAWKDLSTTDTYGSYPDQTV